MANVLSSLADVEGARAGTYLVASGTPAFFPVMGLIEDGQFEYVGEAYEDGSKIVEVRVGGARTLAGPNDQRTITIGSEFFATALKDYREWNIKWWREAVQNSVDAGARTIHLESRVLDDGTIQVSIDDDGTGMDEDTLLSKFLVLGGTTKIGQGGVAGGFGKAKELLLLPWVSWLIHTRNTLVKGAGIDYTVFSNYEPRQGTRLEVRMPPDKYTDYVSAIAFVEKCYLPHVTFFINGKKVAANLKAKDLIIKSEKADFYFTPNAKKDDKKHYYAYVRVRGLYMFSSHIGEIPGHVLVELTAPSVEVLTANRDGFRDWSTGHEMDKFAARIAKDNMSALREKQGMIRKKYRGAGKFRAKKNAGAALEQIGPAQSKLADADVERLSGMVEAITQARTEAASPPAEPRSSPWKDTAYDPSSPQPSRGSYEEVHSQRTFVPSSGEGFRPGSSSSGGGRAHVFVPATADEEGSEPDPNVHVHHQPMINLVPTSLVSTLLDQDFRGPNHIEAAVKQLVWEPDFFVINEIDGFKIPKKFMPETMTPTILRLARVWTELCRYVLMQLGSTAEFGVGFMFSTDARASAILEKGEDDAEDDPGSWLMLNPYLDVYERKEVLRPTKGEDLKWLYAAAVHECTHVASQLKYHDESFAAALTKNFAICADGYRKIKAIVSGIKLRDGSVSVED